MATRLIVLLATLLWSSGAGAQANYFEGQWRLHDDERHRSILSFAFMVDPATETFELVYDASYGNYGYGISYYDDPTAVVIGDWFVSGGGTQAINYFGRIDDSGRLFVPCKTGELIEFGFVNDEVLHVDYPTMERDFYSEELEIECTPPTGEHSLHATLLDSGNLHMASSLFEFFRYSHPSVKKTFPCRGSRNG